MGKILEFVWTDWGLMVLWGMKLTDEQWGIDRARYYPQHRRPRGARGDRQPTLPRSILEGILEITKRRAVGVLPKCFPPYQTYHRWLQTYWRKNRHILRKILFRTCKYGVGARKVGGWTKVL